MRRWLYIQVLRIIRWYFVDKEIDWIGTADGHPIYRGSGRVISGRIERDKRIPVGLTLFWLPAGMPMISGLREAPIQHMHYDPVRRKWTYRETE